MATSALGANTNRDKPNILLLFSDDQGWNDIGWNNPKVHTPNLDRLRKQGIPKSLEKMKTVDFSYNEIFE